MAYNFLIVDDSSIVRTMLERIIKIAGIDIGKVYKAANGREALSCLEQNWVDLVLADINMPEMNGLQLIEAMEKRGLLESTPVVVVSTERSEEQMEQLKSKGIAGYVVKPFTPEAVRDAIQKALESSGLG